MPSRDAIGIQDDVAPGAATEPVTTRPALPMLDDATRSPDPSVCPFFRRELDGRLFAPLGSPDSENVCAAIGVPKPQSARQQELVCLRAAHADCPRYLRGALAFPEPPRPRRQASVPRATVAALLILVLSAGISFGFVVQRGGIDVPVVVAGPGSSPVAVVASPAPSAAPTSGALEETEAPSSLAPASVVPSPSVAPSPSATPSPTPSPTASPTPEPTPKATPRPTKKPTSDRYALLEPCPNRDNCWIYTVRSGDNLFSIAKYFGHSLNTIYRWNPQYPGTALQKGAAIRMPPPTR
ncbi:MAG TPA: LysM peptidoglycan-binding domain-containing protein [Candidatus Limnocylindrales bacterium]|nr:LysM peptidoglycan-binding domain-containing protein [Candidatus Limnocylindrales bacterium]